MAKRNSGPGFGMVLAFALLLAAGFAMLLYWRSHKSDLQNTQSSVLTPPNVPPAIKGSEGAPTPKTIDAPPANAQHIELSPTATVYYWPAADFMHFSFDLGAAESPLIDVDVNQNGRVDGRVDRSYGLDSEGAFCAVYFLRDGVSGCGDAPSAGFVDVDQGAEGRRVAFVVPRRELSADVATARVTFGICHGANSACDRFPADSPGFTKSYMIPIR